MLQWNSEIIIIPKSLISSKVCIWAEDKTEWRLGWKGQREAVKEEVVLVHQILRGVEYVGPLLLLVQYNFKVSFDWNSICHWNAIEESANKGYNFIIIDYNSAVKASQDNYHNIIMCAPEAHLSPHSIWIRPDGWMREPASSALGIRHWLRNNSIANKQLYAKDLPVLIQFDIWNPFNVQECLQLLWNCQYSICSDSYMDPFVFLLDLSGPRVLVIIIVLLNTRHRTVMIII